MQLKKPELIISLVVGAVIGLLVSNYLGVRTGNGVYIDMVASVIGCWAMVYAILVSK